MVSIRSVAGLFLVHRLLPLFVLVLDIAPQKLIFLVSVPICGGQAIMFWPLNIMVTVHLLVHLCPSAIVRSMTFMVLLILLNSAHLRLVWESLPILWVHL